MTNRRYLHAVAYALTLAYGSAHASDHRATLECHNGRSIVLYEGADLESVKAVARSYFEEESDEAGFLCFPHQWEVNVK